MLCCGLCRFTFYICFSQPSGETPDFLKRCKERSLHYIRGTDRPDKECCPKSAWWANEFTGVIYRSMNDLKVATSLGHLATNMSDWQQLRDSRIPSPVFTSYMVLRRRRATWGAWEDIMSPVSLPSSLRDLLIHWRSLKGENGCSASRHWWSHESWRKHLHCL